MKNNFSDLLTKENINIAIGVIAAVLLLLFLVLFIQWRVVANRKKRPKVEDYTFVTRAAISEAKANLKNGLVQSFRAEFGDQIPADTKALYRFMIEAYSQKAGSPYISVENLIPFLKKQQGVFLQGRDTLGGAYVLPIVMSEGGEKSFRLEGLVITFKSGGYQHSETYHLRICADNVGHPIEEVLDFES